MQAFFYNAGIMFDALVVYYAYYYAGIISQSLAVLFVLCCIALYTTFAWELTGAAQCLLCIFP